MSSDRMCVSTDDRIRNGTRWARIKSRAGPVVRGCCGRHHGHRRGVCLRSQALAPKRLGLWARTLVGVGDKWVQVDRGALPAQAVFLVGAERDAYLAGEPVDDARFVPGFAHALEHAGGYAPDEARRVAATLLPEMMSYDPTRPASFPANGRTLTDDAGDAFLAILTNGKVTEDGVEAHSDLLAEVPYLGPPHNISVPSHAPSPVATELRKASRRLGDS